jgi:hypothetical protein
VTCYDCVYVFVFVYCDDEYEYKLVWPQGCGRPLQEVRDVLTSITECSEYCTVMLCRFNEDREVLRLAGMQQHRDSAR